MHSACALKLGWIGFWVRLKLQHKLNKSNCISTGGSWGRFSCIVRWDLLRIRANQLRRESRSRRECECWGSDWSQQGGYLTDWVLLNESGIDCYKTWKPETRKRKYKNEKWEDKWEWDDQKPTLVDSKDYCQTTIRKRDTTEHTGHRT